MHYIGLLDCNNFFVSCERLFRPDLRQRPVVVLSGNDGCVVARSNEVKELGVPMGVPHFKITHELRAAKVAVFSSNFTLYRDISRRIMSTLQAMVGEIEEYSIDEAFFTIAAATPADAVAELRHLKLTIERNVGVPVSLGLAKSKTIAKYASEKEKRGGGVCVLAGESWLQAQTTIDIARVWGVGAQLVQRYRAQQINTVADLLAVPRERIGTLYGVVGCRLYDELTEQPVWPVGSRASSEQKSIMSTRSFASTTHDKAVVAAALTQHIHRAAAELRAHGTQCTRLLVLAQPSRYSDWKLHRGEREVVLAAPTNDTRTLLGEAHAALEAFFDPAVPYKKAGVVLSGLSESTGQASLFAPATEANPADSAAIMQLLDSSNRRFGEQGLQIGVPHHQSTGQSKQQHLSPKYTTNWADIATIDM